MLARKVEPQSPSTVLGVNGIPESVQMLEWRHFRAVRIFSLDLVRCSTVTEDLGRLSELVKITQEWEPGKYLSPERNQRIATIGYLGKPWS